MRLLIYSSICSTIFLPQELLKTESINFSVHTMRYVKILHTYILITHSLFQNILFNTTVWPPTKPKKFSTSFQGELHNPVWPLTSTSIKSQTHSKGNSQNAGLATNQYFKILDPSQGETFTKYRSHSRETSQNTSNFHNFSNIKPIPQS